MKKCYVKMKRSFLKTCAYALSAAYDIEIHTSSIAFSHKLLWSVCIYGLNYNLSHVLRVWHVTLNIIFITGLHTK